MTTNEGPTAVGAAAPCLDFDFDWTNQWLVENDGFGSSRIVAASVNREFGLALWREVARLRAIEAAARVVCNAMVADGGGDPWWKAHDDLAAALSSAQPTPGAARQPEEAP